METQWSASKREIDGRSRLRAILAPNAKRDWRIMAGAACM
jgi:hypothetical protein